MKPLKNPDEIYRYLVEFDKQRLAELRSLEALNTELHFVPNDPQNQGELKPFYGMIRVYDDGSCYVTITRDEESWWLKKGQEICLDFGDCFEFDITPVD